MECSTLKSFHFHVLRVLEKKVFNMLKFIICIGYFIHFHCDCILKFCYNLNFAVKMETIKQREICLTRKTFCAGFVISYEIVSTCDRTRCFNIKDDCTKSDYYIDFLATVNFPLFKWKRENLLSLCRERQRCTCICYSNQCKVNKEIHFLDASFILIIYFGL